MTNRLQPLNLTSFNGGLNLRADAFQLADDESPELLNVEIDPRGGFFSREGWTRWNSDDIADPWDPRSSFVHQLSSGVEHVLVANDGKLLASATGTFAEVVSAPSTPVPCSAEPHLADYGPWGDNVYIACGRDERMVKWNPAGNATLLTATEDGTWADDYTSPTSNRAPRAELVHAHAGYLFVANTLEDSTAHPSRLRWSHPNNPESWAQFDFIDILDGGGAITGIASFRDHLLIFKTSSVWALYGYDSASWQLVNVTRTLGAVHRQAIAQAETAVYFFSAPAGVHAITSAGELKEVSPQLRPTFESTQFNLAAKDNLWLGWVHQRLWFGAPWHPTETAEDARTVFVYDPFIGERGAWTLFRSASDGGLGPFAEGGYGSGTRLHLACSRDAASVVKIDGTPLALDDLDGEELPFVSSYTTGWKHAGFPSTKKSWRRPDFIMKERSLPYQVRVDVFHKYDESAPKRSGFLSVNTGETGAVWNEFDWGDGTLWGPPARGSRIERGRGLGSTPAVRLRFEGEPGKSWGCDAMVLKYIMRRFR